MHGLGHVLFQSASEKFLYGNRLKDSSVNVTPWIDSDAEDEIPKKPTELEELPHAESYNIFSSSTSCTKCSKTFSNAYNLKRHIATHKGTKRTVDWTTREEVNAKKMKEDCEIFSGLPLKENGKNGKPQCQDYRKEFASKYNLQRHVEKIHNKL